MALSRIGGSSAAANSIAIPGHVAGDLIVIWAYRDGSTTPPTVPTAGGTVPTFTTIDGPTGANSCSAVCAYAVAAGTTDTSGTWTNATGISVEVWRGAASPPIGGHAQSGASVASGANIAIPAITLTDNSGSSAILGFAGHQNVTAWNAAPTGYTQRSQVATEVECLSKNSTTSDGAFNVTCTASATGGTRTQQIEILMDGGNRVSQEAVETLYSTSGAKARISQEAVEAIYSTTAAQARVSQSAVEVLQTSVVSAKNRVSQVAVEVLQKAVHTFAATIHGTSSLAAAIGTRFRRFTATIAGTSSLAATIGTLYLRFIATIAGSSSLSATVSHTGSGPHTFTASISGHGTLHVQPRLTASAGTFIFSADEPAVWPMLATNALINYDADDATISGFLQADSGIFAYIGNSPVLPGAVAPPSAVFRFLAAAPTLWASLKPVSGKIAWRGETPTVYPLSAQTGRYVLRGDGPTLEPIAGIAGRFRYAGDGPRVYPLTSPSGIVLWKAEPPTLAEATVIVRSSGIIRYRSDVPVVTPLTEPVTPPPVTGTGLKIQVTV